jgi:hypothetical protein
MFHSSIEYKKYGFLRHNVPLEQYIFYFSIIDHYTHQLIITEPLINIII